MGRFTPQPAVRKGQKARLALSGPSGSGKTWTALEAAFSLAEGERVLVLDTERASASLYADEFPAFDVIDWTPPFDPRELANVLAEMGPKYEVIVVDSLSHFWAGEGGTLAIVDAAAARAKGNSYVGWNEGTPAQNDMVAGLLAAPCHVIVTLRSKTEYVLETDSRGKQVPRKVGMAPVQRADLDYEFTVTAEIDHEHSVMVDKTRCSVLAGKVFKAGHTVELAAALGSWLATAEPEPEPPTIASHGEHEAIRGILQGLPEQLRGEAQAWWQEHRLPSVKHGDTLTPEQANEVLDYLENLDKDDSGPVGVSTQSPSDASAAHEVEAGSESLSSLPDSAALVTEAFTGPAPTEPTGPAAARAVDDARAKARAATAAGRKP